MPPPWTCICQCPVPVGTFVVVEFGPPCTPTFFVCCGTALEFRAAENGAAKNALGGGYLGYVGLGFGFFLSLEVALGVITSDPGGVESDGGR